jgi:pimeloyl-ACP methyl ester carboxylesterase
MAAETPTIVFVHGGWADAAGFDGSIRALRDRGYAVIGAANPLRHLTGDAASLAALLGTISGPMVLVGHSYGGAVISNAAERASFSCFAIRPDQPVASMFFVTTSRVLASSAVGLNSTTSVPAKISGK